jgi:hypothetical protein
MPLIPPEGPLAERTRARENRAQLRDSSWPAREIIDGRRASIVRGFPLKPLCLYTLRVPAGLRGEGLLGKVVGRSWGQEGLQVPTFPRYWSCLFGSLCITLLAVATVTVCVGHPTAESLEHPSLCIESSSPAAQEHDRPVLFADGGTCPLPREPWSSLVPPAALRTDLGVTRDFWIERFSRIPASLTLTVPLNPLPVLRL